MARGAGGVTWSVLGIALAACTGGINAADHRLCAEVERIAAEVAALDPPVDGASHETRHEHRIRASHLVLAAQGDREGAPSPELATVVRRVGLDGAGRDPASLGDGLVDAYDACEAAGHRMDRDPLGALEDG